jgi:hypothetical protein
VPYRVGAFKIIAGWRTPATADSLGQCLTGQNNRKMNATILNAPYRVSFFYSTDVLSCLAVIIKYL